jgi:putative ABC transport system permease protein
MITLKGIHVLNPEIIPNSLYIYAEDEIIIEAVVNEIKAVLVDENVEVIDFYELMSTAIIALVSTMKVFCMVMLTVVLIIIAMILILLIKTKLVREQKQLGINKALGYTTAQLILQMIMSNLPIVLIGTILGGIIAYFGVNPSFVLFLSSFKMKKCNLYVSPATILLLVIAISLWATAIACLCSAKIRKIVPSKMVQED